MLNLIKCTMGIISISKILIVFLIFKKKFKNVYIFRSGLLNLHVNKTCDVGKK